MQFASKAAEEVFEAKMRKCRRRLKWLRVIQSQAKRRK